MTTRTTVYVYVYRHGHREPDILQAVDWQSAVNAVAAAAKHGDPITRATIKNRETTTEIAPPAPIVLIRAELLHGTTFSGSLFQWDAWDTDDWYYYLRYRFGHGEVERCGSRYARGTGQIIASFDDDSHDCHLTLQDFAQRAGIQLELQEGA